jgi:hypothetical protein
VFESLPSKSMHKLTLFCQIGRSKPVAFAVKTNVAFEGSLDDDSPVHGSAVSFAMGDYLHVMER